MDAGLGDWIREFARRAGVTAGASNPIEALETPKLDHIAMLIDTISINKSENIAPRDTFRA
jgi:hypothetical protein